MHDIAEVHDTPLKPLSWACLGVGEGWIDQRDPFQRSTSVKYLWLGVRLVSKLPTAVHDLADVHDTPSKSVPPLACCGAGVGWIDHRDPFQRSANGLVEEFPPELPTAMQKVGDVHDTA
jgi:hypothetical protein